MSANERPSAVQRAERNGRRVMLWSLVGLAVVIGWGLVLFGLFVLRPYAISSSSMEPGLHARDTILAFQSAYRAEHASWPLIGSFVSAGPQRGEVVLFESKRQPDIVNIKRVIGLPGDRIQMRDGVPHINGVAVVQERLSAIVKPGLTGGPERPIGGVVSREELPGGRSFSVLDLRAGSFLDNTAEVEVLEGHYFVLGDNRDNSIDSRTSGSIGFGLIPHENLIGRAELILIGFDDNGKLPDFARFLTWID